MDKPVRHVEWRSHLSQYIDDVRYRRFKFGELDCALFAAGAVHAMTHTDLSEGLRGYGSEDEGLEKLHSLGFNSPVEFAKSIFPTIHPSEASMGDLAIVKTPGGMAFGVVGGSRVFMIHEDRGLFTLDLIHKWVKEVLKV